MVFVFGNTFFMNTLILSSSISPQSKSLILCSDMAKRLEKRGAKVTLVDARLLDLAPCHKPTTPSMETLAEQVREVDNIIIGMGVHCYSINDALKVILDNTFKHAEGKFFGILCAAGGERSYLSTMHLTQICMNEWRMMQLPRIVYATGSAFAEDKVADEGILERLEEFADDFYTVGSKLLA